jgi:penicillin-binding protein 2
MDAIKRSRAPGLILQPVYQRFYPQGALAAHIIGYVGRAGGYATDAVENNEPLFPAYEGREGLEKSFNEQLSGKPGVMHVSFDAQGRKSSEKVTQPPVPGGTVVTTLDVNIQGSCERSVAATKRPGAMVVTNPNTGEILAMASLPSYDLNLWVPRIGDSTYAAMLADPTDPLVPRAYDSAYPPGSTFKIITGLAAMNEGIVDPSDEFEGSPTMEIGGRIFHNHTRKHQGSLSFVPALMVSCNPYFYRSGLKSGADPILAYAARLGFGRTTGIPISGEEDGILPTQDYMLRVHKRRYMPGDVANLSIGQGDLLVTPVQMAHAMACIANGGTVFQPRLVSHVQGVDQKVTYAYELRVRDHIEIDKDVMKAIKDGMVSVVHGRGGTATSAAVPGFKIAAKTGTAQWGQGAKEKVAAWFTGFAPAERPQYAFAVVYEGKEGSDAAHGGSHAAPVAQRVLKEILKKEPKEEDAGGLRKKRKPRKDADDEDNEDDAPPRPRVVRPAGEEEVQ